MTDLVKGLRLQAELDCLGPDCLNTQAANEIERLRSALRSITYKSEDGGVYGKYREDVDLLKHASVLGEIHET